MAWRIGDLADMTVRRKWRCWGCFFCKRENWGDGWTWSYLQNVGGNKLFSLFLGKRNLSLLTVAECMAVLMASFHQKSIGVSLLLAIVFISVLMFLLSLPFCSRPAWERCSAKGDCVSSCKPGERASCRADLCLWSVSAAAELASAEKQGISIQVWLHECLVRGMFWQQVRRFLAPSSGKFNNQTWLAQEDQSVFSGRWPGWKQECCFWLAAGVGGRSTQKLSGYDRWDRCILTGSPSAPAVKRWWLLCCRGSTPCSRETVIGTGFFSSVMRQLLQQSNIRK